MESLLGFFTSPAGLLVLATLDSSAVFFLPLALDLVVVLLAAGHPGTAWLYPLLATAGSVAGAATTYWIGARLGEKGLPRFVSGARLERLRSRLEEMNAWAIGAVGLIPPPFPFTLYILGAGALELDRTRLLGALAAARIVRTGTEAWLGARHGRRIVAWQESTSFEIVVGVVIGATVLGSAWGVWRALRRG